MLDFKNVDMSALKTDLLKNLLVIVVARVLKFYLMDGGSGDLVGVLTSQEFLYSTGFVLLGLAVFWVLVQPVAKEGKYLD